VPDSFKGLLDIYKYSATIHFRLKGFKDSVDHPMHLLSTAMKTAETKHMIQICDLK